MGNEHRMVVPDWLKNTLFLLLVSSAAYGFTERSDMKVKLAASEANNAHIMKTLERMEEKIDHLINTKEDK